MLRSAAACRPVRGDPVMDWPLAFWTVVFVAVLVVLGSMGAFP